MYEISAPRPDEAAAIEALLDCAFGPDRRSKTSYRYRECGPGLAELSLVARDGNRLVGSIAFWPVAIGDARTPALLLGPLAVDPPLKGQGIGRALMYRALAAAANRGHRIVVLVGDPDYYCRFGFIPAGPCGIHMPGERIERVQVRELLPGALSGAEGAILPSSPDSAAEAVVTPRYLDSETKTPSQAGPGGCASK